MMDKKSILSGASSKLDVGDDQPETRLESLSKVVQDRSVALADTIGPSREPSEQHLSKVSSICGKRSKKTKGSIVNEDKATSQMSGLKVTPLSMFFNNKVGSSFASSHQQEAALISQYPGAIQALTNLETKLPVSNRKVRNSGSLLVMLAFLGFLSYILWDGIIIKEADVNMVVHGHDSYGNICGRNNRPIRFVEKSGKNYTDKPYTKYTLINSQFERYTLDQSRIKNGELLYVKLIGSDANTYEADDVLSVGLDSRGDNKTSRRQLEKLRHSLLATASDINNSRSSSTSSSTQLDASGSPQKQLLSRWPTLSNAKVHERVRRSAQSLFESDAVRRNSTLLNNLKSKLMYQYPPMYGYSSVSSQSSSSLSSSDLQVATSSAEHNRTRGGANVATPSSGLERSFESARAGSSRPSSIRVVNKVNLTAANEPLAPQPSVSFDVYSSPGVARQTTSSTTAIVPLKTAPMRPVVSFDEAYNDTDGRFDHMFIVPTTKHTINDVVSHSDASNQLLYLTECVSACPPDHVELVFFRCMPNNWRFSLFPNAINVTQTFIDDILTDLSHCYKELIYTFSLALVLSLGLLILLRFLASVMIWSCILLVTTMSVSMAIYSWLNYYYLVIDLNNINPHETTFAERLATSDKWLIGSIFLTFVAFAIIGVVVFMRKRILLVTKLFRESGKAIADMPMLIVQPLLTFAALIAITVAWLIGMICLQSIKTPTVDIGTGLVVYKADTLYKAMKWYHMFAFLWVSHFAIACQHYVIGASVSKWYFSESRYHLSSPIGTSVSELILYYLGSVALGSLLVAIFKIIRIVIKQIQFLVQRNCMSPPSGSTSNNLTDINNLSATGCCGSFGFIWRLFMWFLDNIVMIINRDAYVEIAIHGYSFLDAARRAFTVLATNPLKLLAMKSVSTILLGVAKICVVFGTVSMAIILLEDKSHQLNYSWSPVVVSAIYAYIVAHWFLSVYEMVIDALFICYCEDFEISKNRETSTSQQQNSNLITQIINSSGVY